MSVQHRTVDESCPLCEEGPRVRMDHEVVCRHCYEVFGGRDVDSPSDKARVRREACYARSNERETYHRSGKYRMFGGFFEAYNNDNGEYTLGSMGDDSLLSIHH